MSHHVMFVTVCAKELLVSVCRETWSVSSDVNCIAIFIYQLPYFIAFVEHLNHGYCIFWPLDLFHSGKNKKIIFKKIPILLLFKVEL